MSVVTYAGSAGVKLPPTPGDAEGPHPRGGQRPVGRRQHQRRGRASGWPTTRPGRASSTGGANRVILCTDGDFNVGVTSEGELVRLIEEQRQRAVFLTVLGYGMGNLKNAALEKLANHGNGHYAYIDSEAEAHKVFVEQGGGAGHAWPRT